MTTRNQHYLQETDRYLAGAKRLISSLPRQMFDTVVVVAQVKLQVFQACGGGSFSYLKTMVENVHSCLVFTTGEQF